MDKPYRERRKESRRRDDRLDSNAYQTFSTDFCRECLSRWHSDVILLDKNLKLIYQSPDVRTSLGNKLPQLNLGSRFSLCPGADQEAFDAFIRNSASTARSLTLFLAGENPDDRLLLFCHRLPEAPVTNSNAARYLLKFRSFAEADSDQLACFAKIFNLTQAEVRLCRMLYSGFTLKEYCAQWNITIGTARSQIHSILTKTNVARQSELIRLMILFIQT